MSLPDDAGDRQPNPAPGSIGAVLARPQFTLLVIGQTVAQLGDRLHNMALIALVAAAAATATTGVEVSKIGVVTLLPTVFAPVVGALVDRWNKQFTMVMCHLMRAIIVAFIPWLYHTLGVHLAGVRRGVFRRRLRGLLQRREDGGHPGPRCSPRAAARQRRADEHRPRRDRDGHGRRRTARGLGSWSRFGWEGWEAGFYIDVAGVPAFPC